ncbi:hypothetical protein E4T66_20485 [Sinimarinibacterium sp. CAU 1509]|uniref:hypothetical protein n=1 Tax=Sinimarinibacterium sp. CAU 1509 TaxID=2562283 RepID=UPI0010ACD65B|nr:hypothetical protein [Sinimarinibacterium sp. CAU 1509]TJY55761.1 hypothetical protein E4T66_20485 [Sinimarinibacterium sp. CAU 1509]
MTALFEWLGNLIVSALSWLLDVFLYVPRQVYALLMDGLATVIEALPAPAAGSAFVTYAASLPSGMGYLSDVFQVPAGVSMLAGALALRFLLRRIPFIGG